MTCVCATYLSHVHDVVARVHNSIVIVVGCGIVWWWICSVHSASGHIKTRQIKWKLFDSDTFTSLSCRLGFIPRAIDGRIHMSALLCAGLGGKSCSKEYREFTQKTKCKTVL
jgi:hypothetical protein